MNAIVSQIVSVVKPPEAEVLTVVTIDVAGQTRQIVANVNEDGSPRWTAGEYCVFIELESVIPQDVLEERGYWEAGATKGMLGASKGNKVKPRTFAKRIHPETGDILFPGFQSSGLIFKVDAIAGMLDVKVKFKRGIEWSPEYSPGDDVSDFFEITSNANSV